MCRKGGRVCGVFYNTSPFSDRCQSGCETATIIATLVSMRSFNESSESAPPSAWRMRYYGPRSSIETRIARFVPRINARKIEVDASRFNKQSSYHTIFGHNIILLMLHYTTE
jgi:hypothetical protein